MARAQMMEENLREAACIGDFEAVEELLLKGVDVNGENEINHWTALHWAAKRGHKTIVSLLLQHGANTQALNVKGETPAFVAKNTEIRALLGETDTNTSTTSPTSSLPITPSYLQNPPLNNNSKLNSASVGSTPSVEINGWQNKRQPISITNINSSTNVAHLNYDPNEELVVKVRVAHTGDPDFIEIEIPKNDLSYGRLLRTCCDELGVCPNQVQRFRKLPDTILRKDKDIYRLQHLQELELILGNSANASLPSTTTTAVLNANGAGNVNGYQSISLYKNQTILY